jgi:hypothetical protein
MKMRHATLLLLPVALIAAQTSLPERVATRNTIRSERDPALTLELTSSVQYVGADRWVLYGVADAEVHVFVEADSAKRVSRLYWIQFEQFLPSSANRYDGYNSPTRVNLGAGREFIVDGNQMRTTNTGRPGSDKEKVLEILKAKGFVLPPEMMYRRMVHLPTPDRRKELMIIYAEDLAPTGFAIADLTTGGRSTSEWPRLEGDLLKRAVERIRVR